MKFELIGNQKLSAWRIAPGMVWVQARSTQFARKLSRRSDSVLVAVGASGGFLRTFEFPHDMAWAKRLVKRYLAAEKVANRRNTNSIRSPRRRNA